MRGVRNWLGLGCCLASIMSLVTCSDKTGSEEAASGREQSAFGQPSHVQSVPVVSWRTLDGVGQSAAAYKGKVLIVDFWATWCGPCKVAIPDLNDLYGQYAVKGLVIVGVSVDKTSPESVKEFVEQFRITYPVVTGDRSVEEAYGQAMAPPQNRVTSLPTTFVINREGQVVKSYVGYQSSVSRKQLEADINQLL